ncbi:hypothetical protein [Tunicatimonas pelagia]|uniref:hypothetical protein n=1 Tax=Tunicatimonas pelagia TaxID=931531 RepID=UPI0026655F88|nr:hypothetical protein [Tunicatimonas pelagia]WKN46088.1 hypothetical protein P0M28_14120 [Tunicatimonas pelagia]
MAHEMVHAQQLIEGRLVQCDLAHYRWKDQACEKVANIAYLDRPWEKEAMETGAALYNAYRSKFLALSPVQLPE